MIRLFRKNRRDTFSQNTVGTYFLYAIGEIILVVIGILIALYIDNRNEEKKNEEKIKTILSEVLVDLTEDIRKTSELIHFYEQKDSLIKQVFTDTLTYEDYKGRSGLVYLNIIINYNDFRIHDNGFTNLMRNSDIIPTKYEPFLDELKQIYINDKKRIEANLETMQDFVLGTVDMYAKNFPWCSELFLGNISDEIIQYHMHDPYYKNELIRYQIIATGNLSPILKDFNQYATVAYISIAKEVEPEKKLPDFISSNMVIIDSKTLQTYRGKYEYPLQEGLVAEVTAEENQLFMQLTGQQRFELFAKSATEFTNATHGVRIVFNKAEEEVSSFTLFQRGQEVEFIKLAE